MDQGQKRGDVPSFGSTLWAGIAGRCPSCRRGKLYSGYLALAPALAGVGARWKCPRGFKTLKRYLRISPEPKK